MSTLTKAALLALACFVAAGFWAPGVSVAQGPPCGPRDVFLDSLERTDKEVPVSMGVTSTGALIEVLASPAGSWSILVTVPGGPTCMVSSGTGWRPLNPKNTDPEA
ncbi:hypothetical protein HBA54_27670 [Pelagibius litoralis]|uniref:Uncharacterized protein n=1 Tax=Pelagibius litoralis TaxID=374515 RepID=A0A967KDP1_9PROT|nr:hypothetical protein [Pelagibius litoralis]NIA72372.1 hypothetical protein [Pelagibius litoralis]